MSPARWQALMQAWGFAPNEDTFAALCHAYAQPQRHYHNQQHIAACLRHLDAHAALAQDAKLVELCLWFHDAVYDVRAKDNEQASAQWAARFLRANAAPEAAVEQTVAMIEATQHADGAATSSADTALLLDLDLAILAAPADGYARFEADVRKEYAHVPGVLYRYARKRLLRQFLSRPALYTTPALRAQWQEPAQRNLKNALANIGFF